MVEIMLRIRFATIGKSCSWSRGGWIYSACNNYEHASKWLTDGLSTTRFSRAYSASFARAKYIGDKSFLNEHLHSKWNENTNRYSVVSKWLR